jgi:hypothetical protein
MDGIFEPPGGPGCTCNEFSYIAPYKDDKCKKKGGQHNRTFGCFGCGCKSISGANWAKFLPISLEEIYLLYETHERRVASEPNSRLSLHICPGKCGSKTVEKKTESPLSPPVSIFEYPIDSSLAGEDVIEKRKRDAVSLKLEVKKVDVVGIATRRMSWILYSDLDLKTPILVLPELMLPLTLRSSPVVKLGLEYENTWRVFSSLLDEESIELLNLKNCGCLDPAGAEFVPWNLDLWCKECHAATSFLANARLLRFRQLTTGRERFKTATGLIGEEEEDIGSGDFGEEGDESFLGQIGM